MIFAECLALVILVGIEVFGIVLLAFWFLPYLVVRYTTDDQIRKNVNRYIEERR